MDNRTRLGWTNHDNADKEEAEDDKDLFKWFYSQRKTRTPNRPNPIHDWKIVQHPNK